MNCHIDTTWATAGNNCPQLRILEQRGNLTLTSCLSAQTTLTVLLALSLSNRFKREIPSLPPGILTKTRFPFTMR